MTQYIVTGMSCAACQARVEKAVNQVPGVEGCAVSLLTNSMGVEGNAAPSKIIDAVTKAGYGASLKDAGGSGSTAAGAASTAAAEDALADRETPVLKKRLLSSLGFLLVLMYFSMGHTMWGWPVPAFFEGNHIAMGLLQMLLTVIVMVINQKFFISGFRGLLHRAPNMDTLVALGASASFGYSTWVLFAMTEAQLQGNAEQVMQYMHEFYFESAAMILTLITVGKMLEAHSKGKTTDALKSLMKLSPKTAVLLVNGQEVEVAIDRVQVGDIFVVRPGDHIPVDGTVLEGFSAVNESALTGESIPVDKAAGDAVSAATINQSGYLQCRATRIGEDTTLSQIIRMVSDAAATKAPIAKIADKVSGIFVPAVITIALITLLIWLLAGQTIGFALARAISVLVISCPCALGLATPVAIMVGNGIGAKSGILFKTAASLEAAGRTEIIALDKTGTITKGQPEVTEVLPAEGCTAAEMLHLAVSLEAHSEHPLAGAILRYGKEQSISFEDVEHLQVKPGLGLSAVYKGKRLMGGNLKFLQEEMPSQADADPAAFHEAPVVSAFPGKAMSASSSRSTGAERPAHGADLPAMLSQMQQQADALAGEGKTPLFFAYDGKLLGMIAVADTLKEDSTSAIQELKGMGLHVVMLTGDNAKTAAAIAAQAGVDDVISDVLPDGKEEVIQKLQKYGKVAMVGDGINDAPALTRADTGIAIGAGTDVAIDAAEVVLVNSRLSDVAAAIRLSRAVLRNIHQNLFWAFFYNVIGIPLAAGAWIALLGWQLNPMFGAAAMSLSSFCVVSNALRLNLLKVHDPSKDRRRVRMDFSGSSISSAIQEEKGMDAPKTSDPHAETSATGTAGTEILSPAATSTTVAGTPSPATAAAKTTKKAATTGETKTVNQKTFNKEENEMKKTMSIEGMMCPHCEAAVKKALEALEPVSEAVVSHVSGTAEVSLTADAEDAVLKKAVEDAGYKVTNM